MLASMPRLNSRQCTCVEPFPRQRMPWPKFPSRSTVRRRELFTGFGKRHPSHLLQDLDAAADEVFQSTLEAYRAFRRLVATSAFRTDEDVEKYNAT